ncbi:MAG: hypothetical protein D9V47_03050 [Clostridia bacterium]|nr:MAG: hypothetical protein D9V47_03050 [Clostridia bacterium]
MALAKKVMVLFDPQEYKRVERRAALKGISVGRFIREAVEKALAEEKEPPEAIRLAAARRLIEAQEPVIEWEELERRLERGHLSDG